MDPLNCHLHTPLFEPRNSACETGLYWNHISTSSSFHAAGWDDKKKLLLRSPWPLVFTVLTHQLKFTSKVFNDYIASEWSNLKKYNRANPSVAELWIDKQLTLLDSYQFGENGGPRFKWSLNSLAFLDGSRLHELRAEFVLICAIFTKLAVYGEV